MRFPFLAPLTASFLVLACGPDTISNSPAETGAETDTGVPEHAGVSVEQASHLYQCIDGCEGFYSDHSLTVVLLAEAEGPALDVEVAWHDWTTKANSELSLFDTPFDVQTVHLEPGVPTELSLHSHGEGFCDNEVSWNEPMRALLTLDGEPTEVAGNSVGSGGWDC